MSDYAQAVYDLVKQNPGFYSVRRLAQKLRVSDGTVHTALVATEKEGLLLYEEEGKFYVSPPFGAPDTLTDKAAGNNNRVGLGT